MSVHRDAYRLEVPEVEIPEHLRYRPPRVDNQYRNVEPRYLNPRNRREPPKLENLLPKERIPENPHYRRVSSRILEPRRASPGPPPIPRFDPKLLEQHATIAAKAWGSAHPRYLEGKKLPEGQPTPREEVETRREANKRVSSWRDVCTTPASLTFDEYRQRNRRLLAGVGARNHIDAKPKPGTHSPVRQYITQGAPIAHHTMGPDYVSPAPRRDVVEPHWTPGGGAGGGKWARRGGPIAAAVAREAQFIRAWREHAAEKKVSRTNVPRVASLSPALSYRRWEQESTASGDSYSRPASTNTTPRRARPAAATNGREDVVVGPVMVAVPAGTAIKFHSTQVNN